MSRTDTLIALFLFPALATACGGEQGAQTDGQTRRADGEMQGAAAESGGQAGDPACAPNQTATTGPVEISLDKAGRIQVKPDTVKLKQGSGAVDFTSDRPFVVIFNEKGGVLPTQAATAAAKARSKAPVRVNPKATCGTYKYSVAVWDSTSGKPVGMDPPIDIVPIGSGADTAQ